MKMKGLQIMLFVLVVSIKLSAQDFSGFDLLANYTLINTAADSEGNYPDIILDNAPFNGDQGVYSNGIYSGNGGNYCYIHTQDIEELSINKLGFSVDFKFEDCVDDYYPIIFAGRYFGARVVNQTIEMFYGYLPSTTDDTLNENQWYHLALEYENGEGKMFIDGALLNTEEFEIDTLSFNYSKIFSNENGGLGKTFKGYLKNLKIYGPHVNKLEEIDKNKHILYTYPNPVSDELFIKIKGDIDNNYSIELYNLLGDLLYKNEGISNEDVDMSNFASGTYILKVATKSGNNFSKLVYKN